MPLDGATRNAVESCVMARVSTLETSVSVGRSVSAAMSRMRVALPWFSLPIPSAEGSSPFPDLQVVRR